ncbi:COMM domain-containing protein 3, partial [Oncorhynchus masou masou]|uniref:COMM domain-containing protein 3 n=1 Tax=Oncorhynchus masou masou TaxID=90313 RepID=UPI003182D572
SATTCILEGVKQNVDKSTISIGRCPPHINDVSWRLVYPIKNGHVHKVNEPSYLFSLNVEDLVGKIKDAAKSLEGYAVEPSLLEQWNPVSHVISSASFIS